MKEGFYRSEYIAPSEKNLHQFKGSTLKDVIEYLEGNEDVEKIVEEELEDKEESSIFDGFLDLLRAKGVRVSTPEWLQFLQVINKYCRLPQLKELVSSNELLNKIRLFAKTTLVKDKSNEAAFHEAFDEYFEQVSNIYRHDLNDTEDNTEIAEERLGENRDNDTIPDIKQQLGIKEVNENLNESDDAEHEDNENVHGGNKDQHNDILQKADKSKLGGGDLKLSNTGEIMNELVEDGLLVGGGKGKSITAERVDKDSIVHVGEKINKQAIQDREKKTGKIDRRMRYEERPDKSSMREVIRNIRRIIQDVSEVRSSSVNLKGTVGNFAKRNFRFDYEREREKQPELVLLIDVGGPVDEWSPLVKEVAEAMSNGLTKLEIYLFHNNLYGYVWRPDPKNLLASSYAKPNSLIDIKSIVKKRKKVIIYGDAEMSYSEFEDDGWPPRGNEDRVEKFGMGGDECLNYIKKKSDATVWINPVFRNEWLDRDDSGTVEAVSEIIPMHDLTVGGVEDAIRELMKK